MSQKLGQLPIKKLTIEEYMAAGDNPTSIESTIVIEPKMLFKQCIAPIAKKAVSSFSIHRFAWLILILSSSAALTSFGFFILYVPIWVAYLPFLAALITHQRSIATTLVIGHFSITISVATLGMISLGYPPVTIFTLGACLVSVIGFLYAYLGVGLSSLALFILMPYMPGNPLLMAGALYPNLGLSGIGLVLGAVCIIQFWKKPLTRFGMVLMLIALPSLFVWSMQKEVFGRYIGLVPERKENRALDGYEVKPIDTPHVKGSFHRLQLDLIDVAPNSRVITGANVLRAGDESGLRSLCRTAQASSFDLFVGVQVETGQGEVWNLNAETCPNPMHVYGALLGIPGLSGPARPNTYEILTNTGLGVGVPNGMGFLTGIEAFSIHRWIAMGSADFDSVVVVSDDHWAGPLPVAHMRKKISTVLGRLFNIRIAHTNTKASEVILMQAGEFQQKSK